MPALVSSSGTSCRDRTSEFYAIAERLRKQQNKGDSVPPLAPPSEDGFSKRTGRLDDASRSEFSKKASRIGLGIHATSTKLNKLTQLAKRSSMFNDPAQEIGELTMVIKQDITALNGSISDLQAFAKGDYRSNKQNSEHSATVVDNLKSRLMNTTKEFTDVLTLRTENLKAHNDRRGLFSKESSAAKGAQQPLFGPPKGSLQLGSASTAASASPQEGGQSQMQVMMPQQTNVMESRQQVRGEGIARPFQIPVAPTPSAKLKPRGEGCALPSTSKLASRYPAALASATHPLCVRGLSARGSRGCTKG
ncbi:hypothetical protein CYMTET_49852 [Cymbomonas tetramitiformis]|uniref:Syntaxin-5 N-terminal Sly1p-binding domain-containing protein n=1 Tax=Cymbomonas tetramitiformis TaxID=36881 RepID=A0AAE0BPA0_9CHLO|nr:hypothetical protein CYMTET_49852 [Cymbomonas tetramitiformis]